MSIPSLSTSDSMATLRTTVNTIATNVGDLALLNSTILSNINPDDLVQAINYAYTQGVAEDNDFQNATTFADAITVSGNAEFEGNLNIDGQLTFDNTGVTITSVLDEDDMTSDSATALATQQSIKAYVDGKFTSNLGAIADLDSGITSQTNPDNVVEAINYVYTLASSSDTNFANPVTFADTITVAAAAEFQGNLNVDGAITFDNTGVAITSILDEDNMSSNSATALATQQSIKAYVDDATTDVDAATLDGIDSSAFLRSNADDSVNSNIHLQFGSGSGSVQIEHNSTDNATYFTPHDGTSYQNGSQFGFDGDTDAWFFETELVVSGLFTSLGIDDNATSNKIQLENSLVTVKTALTAQGSITLTTGDIIGPSGENFLVTNGAGEYLSINGSSNQTSLYAGGNLAVLATSTAANLYYGGSIKLATVTGGVSVTGDLNLTGEITGGSTVRLSNSGNDYIDIGSTTVNTVVNGVTRISATTAGATVTGNLTVGGTTIATAISSTTKIGDTGGGHMLINGSSHYTELYANDVLSVRGSATAATLYYAGGARFATSSDGGTLTGDLSVTGDLDVTGSITGTLGNISTGTISSGAITTSGSLTMTGGGDIILPVTSSSDVGNNAGELIRFNGTNNRTEIFAGSNEQIQLQSTDVQLRYSGSTKLATTSGGITVTGAITATGDVTAFSSDARLKDEEEYAPLTNAMETIRNLEGIAYRWNSNMLDLDPSSTSDKIKIGVRAQDIEKTIPAALGPNVGSKDYMTVKYESLIPVLIEALKDADARIKELENK